jgi:hypothetical protein
MPYYTDPSGIRYDISNPSNTVVTAYTGSSTTLTIPSTFIYSSTTYSVTSIRSGAFQGSTILRSIIIPNSVTSIQVSAFRNCTSLQSIIIPNSVTSIGLGAFTYCPSLQSITIPNSVTSIGKYAFQNCTSLQSITISNSVTSIGDYTFTNCTALSSIIIPNSVTTIGDYAFVNCTALISIHIPENVTNVGIAAFNNTSINTIYFDSSLNNIIYFDITQLPSTLTTLSYNTYGFSYLGPSMQTLQTNIINAINQSYNRTIQIIYLPPVPISNVCFPSGTPISCDQGMIPIEKINCDFHTISNNKIVAITETISQDKYLVCFGKHSLGFNSPNAKTAMSKHHKVCYNGEMIEAGDFLDDFENVKKVKYTGEVLYNILLEKYGKVTVNNMICETLHPENLVAKIYTSNLDVDYKNQLIKQMNNSIIKNKHFKYNEVVNIICENTIQDNDYAFEEFIIQAIENYQGKGKDKEKEQKIYKIEPNEKVFKKNKIFYLSGTDNLNLQTKVEKYAKRAKNTETYISGIIEKKNLLNKAKETKEQKEILKKEIKTLLQLDKNGTKSKTYKNNQTKRRNYTCRYRFLD